MDEKGRGKGLEQMGRGDTAVIDREKVITHFNDAIEASGNNNKWRFVRVDVIKDALELLKDSELVVRCKDCKHGEPGACGYGVDCDGVWHDDDGFCSDGERKEGW